VAAAQGEVELKVREVRRQIAEQESHIQQLRERLKAAENLLVIFICTLLRATYV